MMSAGQLRLFVVAVLFLAIQVMASPKQGRDIFTNEGQTRRLAANDEFEVALGLGGCAGSLIAPGVGISAAHCQRTGGIKSGIALRDNLANDGTIVKTLEVGSVGTLDYWLFEIKWKQGHLPPGMRLVPLIQTEEDQLKTGANETAEKIYTLGFPSDIANGNLIYSWGYGKNYESTSLVNNISLINGNSGGGIWRANDDMLVSIVSGGPNAFGQGTWKNNDWNDKKHWNWGPAMWRVYKKSSVLRDIFPEGRNKYLSWESELAAFDIIPWFPEF